MSERDTALREAAIHTAKRAVPADIDEPLRSELITAFASLLAIGVAQDRMRVAPAPPVSESGPALRVVSDGDAAA